LPLSFVNKFHLGINNYGALEYDILLEKRTVPYDIGAYKYDPYVFYYIFFALKLILNTFFRKSGSGVPPDTYYPDPYPFPAGGAATVFFPTQTNSNTNGMVICFRTRFHPCLVLKSLNFSFLNFSFLNFSLSNFSFSITFTIVPGSNNAAVAGFGLILLLLLALF